MVQKGQIRGSYKRSKMKREQKELTDDGLSYQEIGAILGISAAEVKKIETTALKKLRHPGGINQSLHDYNRISILPEQRIDI